MRPKETDPVKIVVEVIKNLNYATDASKAATYDVVSTSSAFENLQPVDKMEWQTASVVLEGISEGDRILIRPGEIRETGQVSPSIVGTLTTSR